MTQPTLQPLTAADARAVFAAFRLDLQAAMKAAAKAEGWTAVFWPREVALVQHLLTTAHFSADAMDWIVALYRKAAE